MRCLRTIMMSFVAVSLLGAEAAQAQTQAPPSPPSGQSISVQSVSVQASQTVTDVSKWTRKQWRAAKAKWVEEKDAWNGCQTQAKAQNLAGRKSWQFLYDCMTKG